jgi:hypothetical protein
VGTRQERVVLSLEDNFTSGMARAALATAALNRQLDDLNGEHVDLQRNTSLSTSAVQGFNRETSQSSNGINQYSGRLRLLGDALATLGPAAIPITAALVPAIAGLTSELTFAALGAGTAVLAFQGFGKALQTLATARLRPTETNIENARAAMEALSPAAQRLIGQLDDMRGEFRGLRDSASEHLFPGVSKALDEIEARFPEFERIIAEIADTTGDILAEGAESLVSDRWDEFFTFLATDARPALVDLSQSVGNVAHALASLLVNTDPLADNFSKWLVRTTADFDRWATGLDDTQGFQDFLTYLHDTGPQVAATISALATAFLDVIEAASPLGGPVLKVLEVFAKAVSEIAESDLGTPIFVGLAAMTLFTRATALWGSTAAISARGAIAGQIGVGGALRTNIALMMQFGATTRAQVAQQQAAARAVGATIGKSAALIGGLALVSSGASDSIGATNAALGATAGLMLGGPWGAAIGLGIGLTQDFTQANNDAEESMRKLNVALSGTSFEELDRQLEGLNENADAFEKKTKIFRIADTISPSIGSFIAHGKIDEETTKIDAAIDDAERARTAFERLAKAMGAEVQTNRVGGFFGELGLTKTAVAIEDAELVAERAAPAMEALNLSLAELKSQRPGEFNQTVLAIRAWNRNADSAAGRTVALGDAFAGLDDEFRSTEDSAQDLSEALDTLINPQLNLAEATDAWSQALNDINDDLAEHNKTLRGTTDAALQNRDAVRERVTALIATLKADAEAGASSERLTKRLARQRNELIKAGVAAGLSKDQLTAYLKELGLTPKVVNTVFEATGTKRATDDVKVLNKVYDGLPRKLRTFIDASGVPVSMKAIRELKREYDLTPREVKTLITLKDQAAFLDISRIDELLKTLNRLEVIPKIDPDTKQAHDEIEWVNKQLAALDGKHATTTVTTIHRDVNSGGFGPQLNAMGGLYSGDVREFARGGFMDRKNNHPPHIAPGGAWRVFAEPETRGEAYIPLANDHRRPRAVSIWEETGRRLGLSFARNAIADRRHSRAEHRLRPPDSGTPGGSPHVRGCPLLRRSRGVASPDAGGRSAGGARGDETVSTLLISIGRVSLPGSPSPLVLSGSDDANEIGVVAYAEPAIQSRVGYAPDSAWIHGSQALSSSYQQTILGFDVVTDKAASEAASRALIGDLREAISQFAFTVTVTVDGATPEIWSCNAGSIIANEARTYPNIGNSNPVWSVTIPCYPIPTFGA